MKSRAVCLATLLFPLLCALALAAHPAAAQGGPPPELRRAIDATVDLLSASGSESIERYAEVHLTTAYRQSMSPAELARHVATLREALGPQLGEVGVEGEPNGVRLVLGAGAGVQLRLRIGPDTGWKVDELRLLDGSSSTSAGTPTQGDPRQAAVRGHVAAIESLGRLAPDAGLALLEAGHLAEGLFQGAAREAVLVDLAGLRRSIAAAGMITLAQRGASTVVKFRGGAPADVVFELADQAPHRITRFSIDLDPQVAARAPAPVLAWEDLEGRLREAERDGFSGYVIAQRGGRITLSQGYGFADREQGRVPDADTVFDIGSMPIDFTRAAILGLQQEGRLSLDDRIEKYFAEVPADKRDIHLGQLMDGSSGLANFHHLAADADKDLAYVDRETALQRIFAQPLLFTPGGGQSHSHSAFGLLAMVVEIVSAQPYGEFLRQHLFLPAGMTRTGFYGETLGLEDADFAIGYGQPAASPNIPPRWGKVSWLVVGSGGMVSSVADMQRGHDYLAGGGWLRGDALDAYLRMRLGAGGSDRGYFFLRVVGEEGDALFLASNSSDEGPAGDGQLVRSLVGMVLPQRADGPGL